MKRSLVTLWLLALLNALQACAPGIDGSDSEQRVASPGVDDPNVTREIVLTANLRPNILLIVADDLGFTDLGAFGSEISTQHLDRLAHAGLRLNNLHAAASCQPTRVMLMASAGVSVALEQQAGVGGQRANTLSLSYATIPELLKEAGYATYMTGKWDLGPTPGHTPAARGFERSFVQLRGSASHFAEYFISDDLGYEEDGRPLSLADLPDDFYATRVYTDKMLEYLRSTEPGEPWFAYMPYTAPHWPLQLPDEWLDRYAGRYDVGYDQLREKRFQRAKELGVLPAAASLDDFQPLAEPWEQLSLEERRRYARAQEIYAGMVEYLDMSIGRVLSYLENSGQLANTVILFAADHGASAGEHGVETGRVPASGGPAVPDHIDNRFENFGRRGSFIDHGLGFGEAATAPFRFQKGSISEGGLRAAAFVYYPAEIPGGGVSGAFMTMMDVLPTFLEIAGTEHPGEGIFDGREIRRIVGRSAWPHFTGRTADVHSPADTAGWSSSRGGALIRGTYKIINQPDPGIAGTTPWRLYNLLEDPGETRDLAAARPDLVTELVREWEVNWR